MDPHALRIAFDLDDTLIPSRDGLFAVEPPNGFFRRLFVGEWLRAGASELVRELARSRCEVCVYTTSLRRPGYIARLFRCYGVGLREVINGERHYRWMRAQRGRYACSKYPPAFGIDLLVDDSEGVQMESRQFGFEMVLVRPEDDDWAAKVIQAVDTIVPWRRL
jgi:hypothetical protein